MQTAGASPVGITVGKGVEGADGAAPDADDASAPGGSGEQDPSDGTTSESKSAPASETTDDTTLEPSGPRLETAGDLALEQADDPVLNADGSPALWRAGNWDAGPAACVPNGDSIS